MEKFSVYFRALDEFMKSLAEEQKKLLDEKKRAFSVQAFESDPKKLEFQKTKIKYEQELACSELQVFENALPTRIERKLKELTTALEKAVQNAFYANPDQVDDHTLTLLNSGILSVAELEHLFDSAAAQGNHTMQRLIAKKADELAATDKDPCARSFCARISRRVEEANGKNILEDFEEVSLVAERCGKSPSLLDKWETITSEHIASL